jgi:hypothetical protein
MTEETKQEAQPTTQVAQEAEPKQPAQPETQQQQKVEEDLVTRASKLKVETQTTEEDFKFNVNDIEKITDPAAKKYAEDAYKSMQRDYIRKTQELAEKRKQLEGDMQKYTTWTPERVQELLNDPNFVKSAQNVVQTQAEDPYSALSDADKKTLHEIRQQQALLNKQQSELLRRQQDESLKGKYANYNSGAVDIITADLLAGKVQATREHLWKVLDYEDAVRRAYHLGLQDRKLEAEEKQKLSSVEGGTVSPTETPPPKEEKESDKEYFKRLALRRLTESMNKKK